ncbi:hypothetical protein HGRIS_004120 [Hohenbuehelia grisea]|uniref:Uncharacterized protein n=1 Tax=Hohenbuehelia grisea TaxID=104357 RepID=A0ABR3JHI3_9AGAR
MPKFIKVGHFPAVITNRDSGMNWYMLSSSVYVNAYLASLNMRARLRRIGDPASQQTFTYSMPHLSVELPDDNARLDES